MHYSHYVPTCILLLDVIPLQLYGVFRTSVDGDADNETITGRAKNAPGTVIETISDGIKPGTLDVATQTTEVTTVIYSRTY